MNPYTGQTTPVYLKADANLVEVMGEMERAAKDVECAVDDLVMVAGQPQHIDVISNAVKERNRVRNKQARKQRKMNARRK